MKNIGRADIKSQGDEIEVAEKRMEYYGMKKEELKRLYVTGLPMVARSYRLFEGIQIMQTEENHNHIQRSHQLNVPILEITIH